MGTTRNGSRLDRPVLAMAWQRHLVSWLLKSWKCLLEGWFQCMGSVSMELSKVGFWKMETRNSSKWRRIMQNPNRLKIKNYFVEQFNGAADWSNFTMGNICKTGKVTSLRSFEVKESWRKFRKKNRLFTIGIFIHRKNMPRNSADQKNQNL